jgi:hypothetical protein
VILSVITDRLRLLATRRGEMWWDIGLLLDEIATRGLAADLGYADYGAYAKATFGIEAGEAHRLRLAAHHFGRDTALRAGVDKLASLLGYLDACPRAPCVLDLLRLEIPVALADGTLAWRSFEEASADELDAAARLVQSRAEAAEPRADPALAALRARVQRALSGALGPEAPRVRLHCELACPERVSLALVGLGPRAAARIAKALASRTRNAASPRRSRESERATKRPGKEAARGGAKGSRRRA